MIFGGNKRGMSPLIATVLLMAFAVALGGMIMTYFTNHTSNGQCDGLKVEINKFCSDNQSIMLQLRNDKEGIPIEELRLEYIQQGYEDTLRIKDSTLTPDEALGLISIPAEVPPNTQVSLYGVIGSADAPVECTTPIEIANPLPSC